MYVRQAVATLVLLLLLGRPPFDSHFPITSFFRCWAEIVLQIADWMQQQRRQLAADKPAEQQQQQQQQHNNCIALISKIRSVTVSVAVSVGGCLPVCCCCGFWAEHAAYTEYKKYFSFVCWENVHSFVWFYLFFFLCCQKNKLEYEKHRTVPGALSLTCVWEWRLFSEQNYWKSTEVKSFDIAGVPSDKLQVWQAIRVGVAGDDGRYVYWVHDTIEVKWIYLYFPRRK